MLSRCVSGLCITLRTDPSTRSCTGPCNGSRLPWQPCTHGFGNMMTDSGTDADRGAASPWPAPHRGRVLVTGSSRGIGRAIALALAAEGHPVTVHCVGRRDAADAVVSEIGAAGGRAHAVQFDIADRQAARAALHAELAEHGAPYGVVCNAGMTCDGIFPMLTGEEWDRVVHTHLDGFYNVLHPLIMPMIKRRKPGRIVTIASVSGLIGNRGQTSYSAAKAGLIGASKALATELASRRITVNCVAPGLIETDMTQELDTEGMLAAIPAGRAGTPEEVAAVVRFLVSEPAGYVTRQVIAVNGGLC